MPGGRWIRFCESLQSIWSVSQTGAITWLVEGPDGALVTCPSISPESAFLTNTGEPSGPSMHGVFG